jgi:two-component system, response regulator
MKSILLAEDNPDDQELALRAFRKFNLFNDIAVVNDGVEALDYLLGTGPYAENGPPPLPAVVLLDLKMPRKDGLEVLRAIRESERTRFLPVVILTSSKEEKDIVSGYRLGVNSYVTKPVNFSEFLNAIQQLGLYWLIMNEAPK